MSSTIDNTNSKIEVYARESQPFGKSWEEWTIDWWRWLLSVPKSNNPAIDLKGSNAYFNQQDSPVFFLCQTIEGVDPIPQRKITIPGDQSLFMPIINWISILHANGDSDEELLVNAKKQIDVVGKLEIEVNGMLIKDGFERVKSPIFDLELPEENALGLPPGPTRGASDGYWIFFKPFKNNTTLASFGACSAGETRIGANYQISIGH